MPAATHTAFFYGTLLHPSILRRVIGHHGTNLQICPALLLEHTRHQINYADYPGVIPYTQSRQLFAGRELSPEERSVRGTLVSGLSDKDIDLLDIFEGDEYSRESVQVHPLGSFGPLSSAEIPHSSIVPTTAPSLPSLSSLAPPIPAQTYIWVNPISELKPELWEYDEFVKTNSWKWVGKQSDKESYLEVDRRREMNGVIVRNGEKTRSDGVQVVVEVQPV